MLGISRPGRRLLAFVLAGGLAACAATSQRFAPPPPAGVPNLYDATRQVDAYLGDGRYDADVAKVAGAARAWMERRAATAVRPAIVLDIDETALSNWTAYRLNGWARVVDGGCDLERGPCGLRAWQALGRAPALAPTLALVRRARELGVAVFFVSGRPPALRDATERNLHDQGYEWDGLTLLPAGAKFASAVDFKAPARRAIAERGYTILLSMGDQTSDLDGGFAERTFKLPNPVYYLP